MRKHRNEMTESEINAVEAHVHGLTPVIGGHTPERMAEKRVAVHEAVNCVRYGKVIEVHNERISLRAVMRHNCGREAVCAVVEIESGNIITVWKNRATDNHATLNMAAYGWKANMASMIAGMGSAAA